MGYVVNSVVNGVNVMVVEVIVDAQTTHPCPRDQRGQSGASEECIELCGMPLCADYWQSGAEASSGTTGEVHGEMACAIRCRDGRKAELSLVFRGNGSGLRV